MAKNVGKIPPKYNETINEKVKDDVPKAANCNPKKRNNLKTYEKMKSIITELKEMCPPRKSVAYDLLDELDSLLFTLVDECARVPEIIIDGCSYGEENEHERTESVFSF